MAPRRPHAAHVADLIHQGRTHQFLTTTAADLARQVKAAAPDLPPAMVDQLARLVVDHRGRVELPDMLTLRHVSTLTAAPQPAPQQRRQKAASSAQKGQPSAEQPRTQGSASEGNPEAASTPADTQP